MDNILVTEPVISPKKHTSVRHPEVFEQIRARVEAKKELHATGQKTIISRARLVDENGGTRDIMFDRSRSDAEVFDQLWKKVEERRISRRNVRRNEASVKSKDLRELIEESKRKQAEYNKIGDNDSFYSISSNDSENKDIRPSISYAKDLINCLGNENLTQEQKENILGKILELNVKEDVKLAEGLTCASNDRRIDVFCLCAVLMETPQSNGFLQRYLEFLGRVLKSVFSQETLYEGLKKLIEKRSHSFGLYEKLMRILTEDNQDKVFMNFVAKTIYFITSRTKVEEIFGQNYVRFDNMIKKLQEKKMKYINLACIRLLRHWYHYRHDLTHFQNAAYQNLEHTDCLISHLKKFPEDTDCLYGIYYVMNKMPMTSVRAIFNQHNLEKVLEVCIASHQKLGNTDCELLALKIKLFLHNGNFLNEKQQRDAIMENINNGKTHQNGGRHWQSRSDHQNRGHQNGHRRYQQRNRNQQNAYDPDFIPLDYEQPKRASYKGVLKSITDLKTAEPYATVKSDEVHTDRRQELEGSDENKRVEFTYGRIFSINTILKNGYQARILPNANHKYVVGGEICDLLNLGVKGMLLIGIAGSSSDNDEVKVIRGVHMDRKDRDEFRIGLDNVIKDLITPRPPYQRFESPIFNPVLSHPNDDLKEECSHFVIRVDINNRIEEVDKDVKYTMKNTLFMPKKK